LIDLLASYKKATTLPLAVGFGLNNATDIETLKGKAEIAIVGTALLKSWEEKGITDYNKTLLALVAARI
jgi:tryptophan synthase alpha chain